MNSAPDNSPFKTPPPAEADPAGAPPDENHVYTYQSAGIAERKGRVPPWLWVVAMLLAIWGLYYLIAFWNPPA
jgi:hypothetical protein